MKNERYVEKADQIRGRLASLEKELAATDPADPSYREGCELVGEIKYVLKEIDTKAEQLHGLEATKDAWKLVNLTAVREALDKEDPNAYHEFFKGMCSSCVAENLAAGVWLQLLEADPSLGTKSFEEITRWFVDVYKMGESLGDELAGVFEAMEKIFIPSEGSQN